MWQLPELSDSIVFSISFCFWDAYCLTRFLHQIWFSSAGKCCFSRSTQRISCNSSSVRYHARDVSSWLHKIIFPNRTGEMENLHMHTKHMETYMHTNKHTYIQMTIRCLSYMASLDGFENFFFPGINTMDYYQPTFKHDC
jgi:hypothetical protein